MSLGFRVSSQTACDRGETCKVNKTTGGAEKEYDMRKKLNKLGRENYVEETN